MIPISFLIKVILVTASGALSPGPLSVSTIGIGAKQGWKGGIMVSIGHMLVEFPLVIAIALGAIAFISNESIKSIIGVCGGIVLILIGLLMIRDFTRHKEENNKIESNSSKRKKILTSPILVGILLSAFNPYFIIWWVFIGGVLAIEAFAIAAFIGIVVMFLAHIWMDYVWLTFLAYAPSKGKAIFKSTGYKVLMLSIAILLILFGLDLITTFTLGIKFMPL